MIMPLAFVDVFPSDRVFWTCFCFESFPAVRAFPSHQILFEFSRGNRPGMIVMLYTGILYVSYRGLFAARAAGSISFSTSFLP